MKKEHQEEYIRIKTEKLIERGIDHESASCLAVKKLRLKKKAESLLEKKMKETRRKEREERKTEKVHKKTSSVPCSQKKVRFQNFEME